MDPAGRQLNLAFADRFNARDLDGLMALNTADVVFVPAPGTPVTGEDAVRASWHYILWEARLPQALTDLQAGLLPRLRLCCHFFFRPKMPVCSGTFSPMALA